MDRVIKELQELAERSHAPVKNMAACKDQLAASRLSLNGIRALQAVAQQEHYPLGSALQRWLSCRLVERLNMCPPSELNKARGLASQAESRTKVTLTIDMLTDKGGLRRARPDAVVGVWRSGNPQSR